MESNLVSIIVPVYNSEKFIKDTISTVQKQTYNNWELILVDDASTDNGINIIESYSQNDKRIKLIKLETNSGAAIARNKGIEYANGEYIAFLDSDDLWHKEKLEKQLNFMKANDYSFSFTGYEFADENGNGNGKIVQVPKSLNYKQALKNTIISTITVMFDMKKLNKKDIEMPNIRKGQDTATWWKILKNNNIAYGLNESLSIYRRTKNTLSSNKFMALKRTWNLYRKVEKISILASIYYFIWYLYNTIKKRV